MKYFYWKLAALVIGEVILLAGALPWVIKWTGDYWEWVFK